MPGPTTEVLSDDVKALREDLHKVQAALSADIHAVALAVAEVRTELRLVVGVARWAGALLVTTILTTGVAGIWWAATIGSRVGAVEARLDRIEAGIVKAIGQATPKDIAPP